MTEYTLVPAKRVQAQDGKPFTDAHIDVRFETKITKRKPDVRTQHHHAQADIQTVALSLVQISSNMT